MRRNGALLPLLLTDERSAVQRKAAVLFALLVLIISSAGLILMSFGEYTYRAWSGVSSEPPRICQAAR